jgi:hypothetical protein
MFVPKIEEIIGRLKRSSIRMIFSVTFLFLRDISRINFCPTKSSLGTETSKLKDCFGIWTPYLTEPPNHIEKAKKNKIKFTEEDSKIGYRMVILSLFFLEKRFWRFEEEKGIKKHVMILSPEQVKWKDLNNFEMSILWGLYFLWKKCKWNEWMERNHKKLILNWEAYRFFEWRVSFLWDLTETLKFVSPKRFVSGWIANVWFSINCREESVTRINYRKSSIELETNSCETFTSQDSTHWTERGLVGAITCELVDLQGQDNQSWFAILLPNRCCSCNSGNPWKPSRSAVSRKMEIPLLGIFRADQARQSFMPICSKC